ncbi:uncharacterized protein TNCT_429731 [Trichonephila clavata]|uniref:FAM234A/B beta-propeller domain-containing protein n=1 Tax=Trichonephila clavata TaxID=2740835 RepID=A0A8X6M2S8_TRICU|nr:uncharacterized protein TNCT_429731 [Trichonephila clavata]
MKLNATPRHYMPLPQNQSDDDESGPSKEDKVDKQVFKNSFDASEELSKRIRPTGTDEVNSKNVPMSPLRLTMFILSLIVCVLFVIIFVFFVPCTMTQNLNRICHLTHKWRKSFHNISFTSPLDFANLGSFRSRLIILGFEGTESESGLLAVQESNGKESWRLHLHSALSSSLCNVIDVNSDGIKECLVIGNDGLLAAIDVKKGSSLWYLHNHSDLNNANSIGGPVIVPDYDEDNIKDIVISYNMGYGENSSHLALVSGGTGQIIGSLIELTQCARPVTTHLSLENQNEVHVVLHCPGERNGNLWLISSKDIHGAALNETDKVPLKSIFRIPHYKDEIQFYQVPESKNQLIIILDGMKFILLELASKFNFQMVWETYVESDRQARILTNGQFVNGSNQLVIAYSQRRQPKVIGLNLADGKEVWSISPENGTVASGVKFSKFFGNEDGLLLKIISSAAVYDSELLDESSGNSSSDQNKIQNSEKKLLQSTTKLLQERYIFVKCGTIPIWKAISSEEVMAMCKADGSCDPNVYTTNSTVLVKPAAFGASFDMLTVTSTAIPSSTSEEIIIKYLNLENISSFPRCTG